MSPGVWQALGKAALQFLLLVHSEGDEMGRLSQEAGERLALFQEDPWKSDLVWGWSQSAGMQKWTPSTRVEGALGPVLWGVSGNAELTILPGEAQKGFAYSAQGWMVVPLVSLPDGGIPDPGREEASRVSRQLILDQNTLLARALETFNTWESALERRDIQSRKRAWLVDLLKVAGKRGDSDPLVLLNWESELKESEFQWALADYQAGASEEACRVLSGGQRVAGPIPWGWREEASLALPTDEETSLRMETLKYALRRDSAQEWKERSLTGPGLKFWTQTRGSLTLSPQGSGWEENPAPWDTAGPLTFGVELKLPLHTQDRGRNDDVRRLILQGEQGQDRWHRSQSRQLITTKYREWQLKKILADQGEELVLRTEKLLEAGEISRETFERVYFRQQESLTVLGDLKRYLDLVVLEAVGSERDLKGWLEMEALK